MFDNCTTIYLIACPATFRPLFLDQIQCFSGITSISPAASENENEITQYILRAFWTLKQIDNTEWHIRNWTKLLFVLLKLQVICDSNTKLLAFVQLSFNVLFKNSYSAAKLVVISKSILQPCIK